MPFPINCECGKNLNVPDKYAGKRVKCPGCGGALTIPQQTVAVETPIEPPTPESAIARENPKSEISPVVTSSTKSRKIIAIATAVAAMVVIGLGTVAILAMLGVFRGVSTSTPSGEISTAGVATKIGDSRKSIEAYLNACSVSDKNAIANLSILPNNPTLKKWNIINTLPESTPNITFAWVQSAWKRTKEILEIKKKIDTINTRIKGNDEMVALANRMGQPLEGSKYTLENLELIGERGKLNAELLRGGEFTNDEAKIAATIMSLINKSFENSKDIFEFDSDESVAEIKITLTTYTTDLDEMNTSSRKNIVLMNVEVQRKDGETLNSGWTVVAIENP